MPVYIDKWQAVANLMDAGLKDAQKAVNAIQFIREADVRPVVRGEWESKDLDNFRKYEVVCSECKARYIGNYDAYDEPYDFNFCPNCGADMRKEDE